MKVKNAHMQAFPFIEPADDDAIKAYHPGMTMRDEFAKAAMQAWVQATTKPYTHCGQYHVDVVEKTRVAREAYELADAMMEARKS